MLFRQGVLTSAAGYGAKPAGSDKLIGLADINAHHAILIDKGNDLTDSRVGFGCGPAQRGQLPSLALILETATQAFNCHNQVVFKDQ